MTYDDFQHLARLYVVGALDGAEMSAFEEGRRQFGKAADEYVAECRHLESVFALSLQPQRPKADAKRKLMNLLGSRPASNGKNPPSPNAAR
jgi:hypothetical protein